MPGQLTLRELALHLLDIAENSVAAKANFIQIAVDVDTKTDRLHLKVVDNGVGMDEATQARVLDPFYTTRKTRKVGLGLPLLKEAAEACNGFLKIESALGKGTTVKVEFQDSHIDRMPLGDLPSTWLCLLASYPDIHWLFRYQIDENIYEFDDEPIKNEIGDIPLTDPEILGYLRQSIQEGVANIDHQRVVQ